MSKRKRREKDQSEIEERHAKVRVQEVNKKAITTKQDGAARPPQASATKAIEISDTKQDDSTRKAARKTAKHERRAWEKAQRNTDGTVNDAVIKDDGTNTKIAATEQIIKEARVKHISAQEESNSSDIGREAGAKDGNTREKRNLSTLGSKWTMSDPVGGRMLEIDPVFAQDEQHLMVGYGTFVAVYSTSTFLLIRRLQIQNEGTITGIALDSSEESSIYISTTSHEISKWDWKEGQILNSLHVSSKIHALSAPGQKLDREVESTVFTISRKEDRQWLISAHKLLDVGESTQGDSLALFTLKDRLSGLRVLHGGKVIVATAGQKLILGTSSLSAFENVGETKFLWRIVDCPEWITSFDVHSRPSDRTSKKNLLKGGLLEAIDIVVGGLKGSIQIYEDLIQKLLRKESSGKANSHENITSRNLHWHRNAVMTVKWSLDGNYIISGGQETVLVIWQLETGQKQYLPHLGAPIESIVVSPSGSSYCVRLADNSAMILSTSELRPTFSIAGIQIPTTSRLHNTFPHVPTVDAPRRPDCPKRTQYPACVSSSGTDRLSLAVPPFSVSGSSSNASLNASYLQTCDISTGHQVLRQALTRTKITTLNRGPESNTIEEPNVTHMQISHDRQWLATIDEWIPPKQDLASLAFDEEAVKLEQIARQEIYLKFWSWNSRDQVWELVSRIDNSQAVESGSPYGSSPILDLAANPVTASFSSIGRDGLVKMWTPVARTRREMKVRGKNGDPLLSWRCQRTVSTGTSDPFLAKPQTASLAYSPDGSLLAAAPLASSSFSPIYLIDTSTGLIQFVHNSMSSGPILGMGIISKYLIILSHHLQSWDLVNNELHYEVDLHLTSLSKNINKSLLAIDHRHGTFAVALPEKTESGKVSTKLAIMEAPSPQPLFSTSLSTSITNLVPAVSKKGFYAIDTNAEIRSFTPQVFVPASLPTPPRDTDKVPKGINGIFGPSQKSDDVTGQESKGLLDFRKDSISANDDPLGLDEDEDHDHDHDTVVVSADKLAEVFDTGTSSSSSALSMPPIMELFERVASLFDGRIDS